MPKISLSIYLKVADTLLPQCKKIKEPFTYERSPGDSMSIDDFVLMLEEPIKAHRSKAEAYILAWLTKGKAKPCSGYTAFEVSEALYALRASIGKPAASEEDSPAPTGPPYDAALAATIARKIMELYFDHVMDGWVNEEADTAYQSWKVGFDEYYNGPAGYED